MAKTTRRTANSKPRQRNLPHLASRLFGSPLLIDERKLEAIVPAFIRRLNGDDDIEPASDDAREPAEMSIDPQSGIAVIPVIGSIVRRPTWLDAFSGLTSYDEIAESLECALNDARVKGILFQIDSFGGEAPGCFELCDKIFSARALKPIWGIADVDALSAGYGILSSCERCYGTARGATGSIGVVCVHVERSQANAMMGVTYTVFRGGMRKGDLNPYEKLSADAAQKLQASIERTRQTFVETVARNRSGVTIQAALDTEGQWYDPEDALTIGLIDGVSTYENVFSEFLNYIVSPGRAAIEAPEQPPAPDDADPDEPNQLPVSTAEEIDAMEPTDPKDGNKPAQTAAAPRPVVSTAAVPPAVSPGPAIPDLPNSVAATTANGQVVNIEEARQPAEARAMEIANMCRLAGFPAAAVDFQLNEKLSVEEVRAKLIDMRAEANAAPGLSGFHAGGSGAGMPGNLISRPDPKALASWTDHFKTAQAANPKFAAAARR